MTIRKSAEDYLEAILRLQQSKGYARSVDIATALSVSKPSVSVAMRNLRENGFITVARDNMISLTESGLCIAENIYERHRVLTEFFKGIGVEESIAEADACKVEHDLSPETFEAIRKSVEG